jgi:serine/threonine protein kinase
MINIKSYFNDSVNSIHKARNEIKVINYETQSLVVKSFKIPNKLNQIIYTYLKASKAQKSYDNSMKILDFVPFPIGYIEFKKYGFIKQSYFVSENFDYDFTIREVLLDNNFTNKEQILQDFAKFTFALHEQNVLHLDYSPGNILIKKENNTYIFKIVDVNRMKFKKLTMNNRALNFSKLWANNNELDIIATAYLKYYKYSSDFIQVVQKYSQKNKNFKNFKKRLKGQEVND